MTQNESESWREFYKRWPFDDVHRFHRPAARIAASMGGRLQDHLDWLVPPFDLDHTEADRDLFRAAGISMR